jgi:hypothetical protein
MVFSPELVALAQYLCGEFENREQAIAEPARYVHLRLWQRPVPLFQHDSLTLFAEQASIVNLNNPYRPRVMRLQAVPSNPNQLQVQYYRVKSPETVRGAGQDATLLKTLALDDVDLLPGCTLNVTCLPLAAQGYHFHASLLPEARCCFTYQGEIRQVSLGFEATPDEFLSYDKGIDTTTGQAIWGALWGPFKFVKRQDFASELAL